MFQKKRILILLPLMALAIVGCDNQGTSSIADPTTTTTTTTASTTTSNPDPTTTTTSEPDPTTTSGGGGGQDISAKELWDLALEKDYSNSTTYSIASSSEGDGYPTYIYNYDGYNVVHDYTYNYMYGETIYSFYHDYEGESHLYFEDEGNGDAWLSKGYHDAPLGIENSYFDVMYMQEVLKEVEYSDIMYTGLYYITDETVMAELNQTLFLFEDRYIEYCCIAINESSQCFDSIIGFVNYDDDQNYVECSIYDIGNTTFTDAALPPEPNSENVRTYAEYKGEEPWVETHVTSLNLQTLEENASLTLDLDETLLLKVDYLPLEANTMMLTPVSENEDVVLIDYASETRTYEVYGLHEGKANVYILDEVSGVISNKIEITVNGVKTPTREDAVNDITFRTISLVDGSVSYIDNVTGASPVEFSLDDNGNTDIRAHASNSLLQLVRPSESAVLYFEPGQGGANNPEAYLDIDTLDNQIDGLSFYYGLPFEDHLNNVNYISAKIYTSTDGNEYTLAYDFSDEYRSNVSIYNMSLFEYNFDSLQRYVRIEFDTTFIGKNVWTIIQGLRLYKTPSSDVLMESVTFNEFNQDVYVDDTFQTPISILPLDTTDKTVTFTSSDPEVVEVVDASNGNFKALKAGSVTLTVTANQNKEISDTLQIEVKERIPDVNSISITSQRSEMECDMTSELTVTVDARDESYKGYELTLNDNTLGQIVYDDYNNPSFQARKPGVVTITATSTHDNTKTSSVTITITPVAIDNYDYDSATFDLLSPSDYSYDWEGNEITSASARLVKDSDDTVELFLTVDEREEISFYAYSYSFGEGAYFRSYDEELALDVVVSVTNQTIDITSVDSTWWVIIMQSVPAEGVEISRVEDSYTVGDTIELSVSLLPDYTTDSIETVLWTIGEGEVVTTSDSLDGETLTLTANSAGSVTVSVLVNGEFSDKVTINVEEAAPVIGIPEEYYGSYTDPDGTLYFTIDEDGLYIEIEDMCGIYGVQYSVTSFEGNVYILTDEANDNVLEVTFNDDGTVDLIIYNWNQTEIQYEYYGCTMY